MEHGDDRQPPSPPPLPAPYLPPPPPPNSNLDTFPVTTKNCQLGRHVFTIITHTSLHHSLHIHHYITHYTYIITSLITHTSLHHSLHIHHYITHYTYIITTCISLQTCMSMFPHYHMLICLPDSCLGILQGSQASL